jgi:SMI1 / KNR4 family (SUKH-1)
MNRRLAFLLGGFYKSTPGVSENMIAAIQKDLDFEFPPDYLEVMREFDGGEGDLGENGFLILFSLEETVQANKDYSIIMTQIPDYYLIGKDAADTGFAFYKPDRSMHSLGLTAVYPGDPIIRVGNNFSEFLYNS